MKTQLAYLLTIASKDTPMTRETICCTFHVSDRRAREMIEQLRDDGTRVCGTSKGAGYWIARTEKEYQAFKRDYCSKATTILGRVRKMDNNPLEGQVGL